MKLHLELIQFSFIKLPINTSDEINANGDCMNILLEWQTDETHLSPSQCVDRSVIDLIDQRINTVLLQVQERKADRTNHAFHLHCCVSPIMRLRSVVSWYAWCQSDSPWRSPSDCIDRACGPNQSQLHHTPTERSIRSLYRLRMELEMGTVNTNGSWCLAVTATTSSCRCSSLGGGILRCICLFCNTWDSGANTKSYEPCFYGDVTGKAQTATERVSACDTEILRCRLHCNTADEQRGFLYHTCTNI